MSLQEQGAFLQQHMASLSQQLESKDEELKRLQQQVQQAQQAQQAEHAQQAHHAERAHQAQQFVAQRVKELQSRHSSPEKSLSSVSSRLHSPRAGLHGEFDALRAGQSPDAANSPRTAAMAMSTGTGALVAGPEAGQIRQHIKAEQVEGALRIRTSAQEALHRASDNSPRTGASCLTPVQSGDASATANLGGAVMTAAAGSHHSTSPLQGQDSDLLKLQQISSSSGADGIRASGRQIPPYPNQASGYDDEALQWPNRVEGGSPGMELPPDEEPNAGSRGRLSHVAAVATSMDHDFKISSVPRQSTLPREDSAQFGPEASAFSLPGVQHTCLKIQVAVL